MRCFAVATMVTWIVLGALPAHGQEFLRGDVNANGRVEPIEDAFALLDWEYNGGPAPTCLDAADVNNNGEVRALTDSIRLLAWALAGGALPPSPGVESCGVDTGAVSLGCETAPVECPTEGVEPELDETIILSIGSATVTSPTVQSVLLTMSITTGDDPVVAAYFGVCHDPEVVCVARPPTNQSGGWGVIRAEVEAFFLDARVAESSWGGSIVFAGLGPEALPANSSTDLFYVAYSIVGEGTSDLTFCDHPVGAKLPVRAHTESGPRIPAVENGSIVVTTYQGTGACTALPPGMEPPLQADDPLNPYDNAPDCMVGAGEGEYTFSVGEATGFVGNEVTIPVSLAVDGSCVIGWVYGLCYDEDHLSFVSGELGYDASLANPFFFAAVESGTVPGNMLTACVLPFDVAIPERLDPYEIAKFTFTIEQDFGSTELTVCEGHGVTSHEPGVAQQDGDVDLVTGFKDGIIHTSAGLVTVIPTRAFERGDVNGDGLVGALEDSLYLLRYAFVEAAAPQCMDAADVNDDGAVSGIVDTIYLLRWGYLSGDTPPAPFGICGDDISVDQVSCVEASAVCTN